MGADLRVECFLSDGVTACARFIQITNLIGALRAFVFCFGWRRGWPGKAIIRFNVVRQFDCFIKVSSCDLTLAAWSQCFESLCQSSREILDSVYGLGT